MSRAEFAILGAGAIGSILGAHLARAGCSVVMLARGRRGQQIEREGLRIRGLAQIALPVPVVLDPARLAGAEVLIVATKAIDTAKSLEPLRRAQIEDLLDTGRDRLGDHLEVSERDPQGG